MEYSYGQKIEIIGKTVIELEDVGCLDGMVEFYNAHRSMLDKLMAVDLKEEIHDAAFMEIAHNVFTEFVPDAGDFFNNHEMINLFGDAVEHAFENVYPKFLNKINE
jgi:hypothetical protein